MFVQRYNMENSGTQIRWSDFDVLTVGASSSNKRYLLAKELSEITTPQFQTRVVYLAQGCM